MRTNQAHIYSLPSHKPEGHFLNRDLMKVNPYQDGIWTESRRYAH